MTRPGEQDSQLNVRIPAEMKLWLREMARSTTDCNMSDLAREAIKLLMDNYSIIAKPLTSVEYY